MQTFASSKEYNSERDYLIKSEKSTAPVNFGLRKAEGVLRDRHHL
jgi:hypothetical protein